jgi:hypothetical protein
MVIDRHKDDPVTNPVLSGLIERRTEILTEIRRLEVRFQALLLDLEHLDATILQFDPPHRLMHPVVRNIGAGGQIPRGLLTILRKSPEPMTLRAMSIALMQSLGLDHKDPKRLAKIIEQTRAAMQRQKRNGTVASELGPPRAGPGRIGLWRIANA